MAPKLCEGWASLGGLNMPWVPYDPVVYCDVGPVMLDTLDDMRLEGDVDMITLVASSNLFSRIRLHIKRSSSFGILSI